MKEISASIFIHLWKWQRGVFVSSSFLLTFSIQLHIVKVMPIRSFVSPAGKTCNSKHRFPKLSGRLMQILILTVFCTCMNPAVSLARFLLNHVYGKNEYVHMFGGLFIMHVSIHSYANIISCTWALLQCSKSNLPWVVRQHYILHPDFILWTCRSIYHMFN